MSLLVDDPIASLSLRRQKRNIEYELRAVPSYEELIRQLPPELDRWGTACRAPITRGSVSVSHPQNPKPLGRAIGSYLTNLSLIFKSAATKRMNKHRNTPGVFSRNDGHRAPYPYPEPIIRTEETLNRIRRYLIENPLRWGLDRKRTKPHRREDVGSFWKCKDNHAR